jgi:outer membrane protein OmpA-like peptidoglycan-associated protein
VHSPWNGNQSRLRSLANPQPANSVLQRKLTIGATNDPLEIEADRTADRILRMPDKAISAPPAAVSNAAPLTLRRCSCGGSSSGGSCDKCKDEDELQRKRSGPTPVSEAPAIVHEVLRSSGRPLDRTTRSFFEPRFGHDFSGVRIHTGAVAAESARQVHALAYTVGSNVVFRSEQFAPDTASGRRLLAHELTHVVQQRRNGQSASPTLRRAEAPSDCPPGARIPKQVGKPDSTNGCYDDREIYGPGKVQAFGKTRWVLSNFDVDQHYIKKKHFNFLKNTVAPEINATPAGKFSVMVVGEASTTADFDYNLDLSKWRANCVAEELVAAGLDDQHQVDVVAQTGELRGDLEQISHGIDPRKGIEKSENRMVTIFLLPAEPCTREQKSRAAHNFYAWVACKSPTEILINIGVNDCGKKIYREFVWIHNPWPEGCAFIPGLLPLLKSRYEFVDTAVDLRLATKDPDDRNGPSDFAGPLIFFANRGYGYLANVYGLFELFKISLNGEWKPQSCEEKSSTVQGWLEPHGPVMCGWVKQPPSQCDFTEKKDECSDDHEMAASKRFNGKMRGGSISAKELLELLTEEGSAVRSWLDRLIDKIPSFIRHLLDPGGIVLNVLFGTKDPNLNPPLTRSFVFVGAGNQGGGSSLTDHVKSAVAPAQDATTPSQLATEKPDSRFAHSDLSTYWGKVVIHGASNKIELTTGAGTFNFFTPDYLCNDGGTRTYQGIFLPRGSVNCPDEITQDAPSEKECKAKEICPESTRTAGHKEFTAKVGRATTASLPPIARALAMKMGCKVDAAFVNIQSEDGPKEKQISRQFVVLINDKNCRFTVAKAHVPFSTWLSRQLATKDPDERFASSDFTPGARISKDGDLSLISDSNLPVKFKLPGVFDPACKDTSGGWGVSLPASAVECKPAPEPKHDITPDVNHTDDCNRYRQNHSDFVDAYIQSMGAPDYQKIFANLKVGAAFVPPDEYSDYKHEVGLTISPAVFLGLAPNPQGGSAIQVVGFADIHINRITRNGELIVQFLSEVCAFDSFGNVVLIRPELCTEGWVHVFDSGILVPTRKDETVQPPKRYKQKTKLVQPKLAIGSADDPLEAEADRTADRVVRMPDQAISAPSAISHAAPPTLRRCSCGGTCNSCREEDEKLRRKPSGSTALAETPPSVHETLRSPGAPLEPATRAFMEPRFARDFSDVRVHTGDKADESARQVNALAYTVGSNIVLRRENFAPDTADGKRLLAHELTHVVQQNGASRIVQRAPDGEQEGDPWDKLSPVVREDVSKLNGQCDGWLSAMRSAQLAHGTNLRAEWYNKFGEISAHISALDDYSKVQGVRAEFDNYTNVVQQQINQHKAEWNTVRDRYLDEQNSLASAGSNSTDYNETAKQISQQYNDIQRYIGKVINVITDEDFSTLKYTLEKGRHIFTGAVRGARIRAKKLEEMMDVVAELRRQGEDADKIVPGWSVEVITEKNHLNELASQVDDRNDRVFLTQIRDELLAAMKSTLEAHKAKESTLEKGFDLIKGGVEGFVGPFVEAAKEAYDLVQIDLHFSTFGWYEPKFRSDMAAAAEQGATTGDLLKGMVTGLIETPARFLKACEDGDYEAIGKETVNLYMLAKLVKEAPKLVTEKLPNAVKRLPELLEKTRKALRVLKARTLVRDLGGEARITSPPPDRPFPGFRPPNDAPRPSAPAGPPPNSPPVRGVRSPSDPGPAPASPPKTPPPPTHAPPNSPPVRGFRAPGDSGPTPQPASPDPAILKNRRPTRGFRSPTDAGPPSSVPVDAPGPDKVVPGFARNRQPASPAARPAASTPTVNTAPAADMPAARRISPSPANDVPAGQHQLHPATASANKGSGGGSGPSKPASTPVRDTTPARAPAADPPKTPAVKGPPPTRGPGAELEIPISDRSAGNLVLAENTRKWTNLPGKVRTSLGKRYNFIVQKLSRVIAGGGRATEVLHYAMVDEALITRLKRTGGRVLITEGRLLGGKLRFDLAELDFEQKNIELIDLTPTLENGHVVKTLSYAAELKRLTGFQVSSSELLYVGPDGNLLSDLIKVDDE